MNRKSLILLAMAATFAVPSAAFGTDISGIQGSGGIYNINPEFIGKEGGTGFRKYDNFTLSNGDTANLIFSGEKNGKEVDVNTFVNLVKNQVNINGILNTMKDGNFYNGHAVFITPGGMVVGASGVLNVGRLSTVTPSTSKFNEIGNAYDKYNADRTQENATAFTNTGVMNFLSNSKTGGEWGSNAPITVEKGAQIVARDGVVLRGNNVNIAGSVVNGVNAATYNKAYTDGLFDSLVNTDGIKAATAKTSGGQLVIESTQGMTVTGNVLNNDNGGTYITNNGTGGMKVSGEVYAKGGTARLYSTKGDLAVGTTASAKIGGTEVQILNNQGGSMTLGQDATTANDNSIAIGSAEATGEDSIAIGTGAFAEMNNNIAIGTNACENVGAYSNVVCIGPDSGPDDEKQKGSNRMYLGNPDTIVYLPGHLVVGGAVVLNAKRNYGSTILRAGNNRGGAYGIIRSDNMDGDDDNLRNAWDKDASQFERELMSKFEINMSSDRRLKYVGKASTSGLYKIRQLKVFNYTFKKDEKKTPHVGVIAQDLQKVFPDAVKKGVDGFLTIRFEDMFFAMINAIKELDSRITMINAIKELDSRITALEKENQELKEQNKQLDARLKIIEAKLK